MARYYATGRGRFAKTHIMTGYGGEFLTNCGLRFKRRSKAMRELTLIRVTPTTRKMNGYVWAFPLATCESCRERALPPYFNFPSEKRKDESGPEGIRRGQQGGLDVDLHRGGHDSSEHGPRRVYPPEGRC